MLRLLPHARIGFLHHLFAEVDADEVVLEDVVVEHVFGCFAEVDDPLGQCGGTNAEGHVLRVAGAGGVVVAADAADAAGDEVGVARIFALHEDAVAAKDRRRAVALGDVLVVEVDLGEDTEAADDAGDGIPVHFDEIALFLVEFRDGIGNMVAMALSSFEVALEGDVRVVRPGRCGDSQS